VCAQKEEAKRGSLQSCQPFSSFFLYTLKGSWKVRKLVWKHRPYPTLWKSGDTRWRGCL